MIRRRFLWGNKLSFTRARRHGQGNGPGGPAPPSKTEMPPKIKKIMTTKALVSSV